MNSNKRKRTAASRASRKAAAKAAGGGAAGAPAMDPPFGYRTTEDGAREAEPAEIVVIERILELAKKRSKPADLAKKLNDEELTARGNPWDARAVARILRRVSAQDRRSSDGRVGSAAEGHGAGPLRGASGRGS